MCHQLQLCTFLGDGDKGVGSNYSLSGPFPAPQVQEEGQGEEDTLPGMILPLPGC